MEPGVVAIEWPERLTYRPQAYLDLHLAHPQALAQVERTPDVTGAEIPGRVLRTETINDPDLEISLRQCLEPVQ